MLHLSKVADEADKLPTFPVQEAVARLQIPMYVAHRVQVGEPRGDVPKEGVDVLDGQPPMERLRSLRLAARPSAHLGLQLFLGRFFGHIPNDVVQQVPIVAVLLQYEGACYRGAEAVEPHVLEPDVTVGHEVWMG